MSGPGRRLAGAAGGRMQRHVDHRLVPPAHGCAAHALFLPFIPTGRATPIRCLDAESPGFTLERITAAASAYGMIISGIFIANSGSTRVAGNDRAIVGNGVGRLSIETRSRCNPMAGCSTIGPGHNKRQSRSDRCSRSKFFRCGQYVSRTFGRSTPSLPLASSGKSAAPARNQHIGRSSVRSVSNAVTTLSTSLTNASPSVTNPAQETNTS